jgi:hypothetical protein
MALASKTTEKLTKSLVVELDWAARKYGARIQGDTPANILKNLVYGLQEQSGEKIAVLIDEYDAPITSQINDVPLAIEIREELRDFYVALKSLSDNGAIHFIFVTGVTKFAKASVFSVFNNLADLTLYPLYHGICGFTLEEFDSYFTDYLEAALEYNKSKGFVDPSLSLPEFRQKSPGILRRLFLGWGKTRPEPLLAHQFSSLKGNGSLLVRQRHAHLPG